MATDTINDRIERAVREWPQWSAAERRRMDAIVAEVFDHCRNGTGNRFVREWCERHLYGIDRTDNREEFGCRLAATRLGVPAGAVRRFYLDMGGEWEFDSGVGLAGMLVAVWNRRR